MPVTVGAAAISEIITTTPETDGASAGRPLATTPVDELARVKAEFAHYKTARERELATLLKLTFGMATGGYKYDATAIRSPVPNRIATDLELAGVRLDADAVLKWLRAGAERAKD